MTVFNGTDHLSVIIGSTRVSLRAGSRQASSATAIRKREAPVNVIGSVAPMP